MGTDELPPKQNLKRSAQRDHQRAEILRLDLGLEGCGCSDCQALYQQIDLEKYGHRVKRYAGTVLIMGRAATGPDGPGNTPESGDKAPPAPRNRVSKLHSGSETPRKSKQVVLIHPGGRPRKSREEPVSRMTAWRRREEEVKA